jgi:hypothetical protein
MLYKSTKFNPWRISGFLGIKEVYFSSASSGSFGDEGDNARNSSDNESNPYDIPDQPVDIGGWWDILFRGLDENNKKIYITSYIFKYYLIRFNYWGVPLEFINRNTLASSVGTMVINIIFIPILSFILLGLNLLLGPHNPQKNQKIFFFSWGIYYQIPGKFLNL